MKKFNLTNLVSGILFAFILSFVIANAIHPLIGLAFGIVILLMVFGVLPMPVGMAGANYVPSALVKAQAKLTEIYQKSELREIDPTTYKAFRRSSEIMIPSHKILRTREDRSLEAYYKKRTKRSLGTGRVHNPSGVTGDSAALVPSFITYNDKFSVSMKQADNNVFAFDEMFANEIDNVIKNFSVGNETTATDFLFTNRSQVSVAAAEITFNAVTFAHEINESTVGNRAVQITDSAMAENLYGEMPTTIFCDSIAFNKFKFLAAQGATNATNTSFQFDGKSFVRSLYLTAKAATLGYTKGFWIAAVDGTYSVMDWIPKQNREGKVLAPYNYASFLNPIDGLDYAVFYTYVAQDSTAVGGYTQDILTNYEFSVDLAFENAPLTTANETTLQAFALV